MDYSEEIKAKAWNFIDTAAMIKPPEVWPWEESQEGISIAPEHHRVIFENEHMRVIELWILPGHKEPLHTHKNKSLLIIDSPIDMRYYGEDGQVKFERPCPEENREKTSFLWHEAEGLHGIENIDNRVLHGIRIELLK